LLLLLDTNINYGLWPLFVIRLVGAQR